MSNKPTNIEAELHSLNFSRDATLSQLITDWPRLQNIIYINNQPLSKLFEKVGLDPSDLNAFDGNVRKKFKQILSPLVPEGVNYSDNLYDQLASVLHQGGLPFRLESQVASTLNLNERMLDNVKRGMSRRVDLVSIDSGFSVREVFIYNGNISKRDPDNPEFVQSQGHPMLSGRCEYQVQVSNISVQPQLKSALLSTNEPKLETILNSQVPKTEMNFAIKMQSFKEKLADLKVTTDVEKVEEKQYRGPKR